MLLSVVCVLRGLLFVVVVVVVLCSFRCFVVCYGFLHPVDISIATTVHKHKPLATCRAEAHYTSEFTHVIDDDVCSNAPTTSTFVSASGQGAHCFWRGGTTQC